MDQSTYRQQQLQKLDELIKNIRIAMLTTVEEDGSLRSRPMAAPQMAFQGELWFFTSADAPKVAASQQHRQATLTGKGPQAGEHAKLVVDERPGRDITASLP